MSERHWNLRDPHVRGELERTPEGRRALEHQRMAATALRLGRGKTAVRHHRRTAQRIARKLLGAP